MIALEALSDTLKDIVLQDQRNNDASDQQLLRVMTENGLETNQEVGEINVEAAAEVNSSPILGGDIPSTPLDT